MPISFPPNLDPDRIPVHVAIIMDGNGRWARAQGQERLFGHYNGYIALKNTVYGADDLGVRYLTAYGFSSENWRRPEGEVGGLMDIKYNAMRAEMDEMHEKGIRFRLSGRREALPTELRGVFEEAIEKTANNTQLTLNLAVNYGGRAEIVDAVAAIAEKVKAGALTPQDITEELISQHLYYPDMPDPDLLIRTAGERRLSNFLLWETAYSEIWVTNLNWPEFGKAPLIEAIEDYQKRIRRFGAVVE